MTEPEPTVDTVLAAAVAALDGEERAGQQQMAAAVESAMSTGVHLLVQAGTGTGKSLGYLVPALLHGSRVIVATATLALQHQLMERDIPALLDAVEDELGGRPAYAVMKGRGNYACLHRVRDGVPDDQGALLELPAGSMGAEVVALREWAEEAASSGEAGDRDGAPRHTERAWRQISVSHRECLGAARCPYGVECFAERARARAFAAPLVVTNHSLLAIDAIQGVPMLPDYDVVVIDEAHELVARVTQAETAELAMPQVDRAVRRAGAYVDGAAPDNLGVGADALRAALADAPEGRLDALPEGLAAALVLVRDAARACLSGLPKEPDGEPDAGRQQARGLLEEVRVVAERLAAHRDDEVTWLVDRDGSRGGHQLCVAPLEVWARVRDRLLSETTVVCTSATLKLGGDFASFATSIGLHPGEELAADASPSEATADGESARQPWRGLDVGSPFDYQRQAILYIARSLPPPGRDGLGEPQLGELADLLVAADGGTLGLFSSRRAAEFAAERLRERLPHLPILCQGDGQLSHLREEFVANPAVSLFGTLSLWQGLDVPGDTCRLVVIDRIPFPRPDDPLLSARARAVDRAGGNGFMAVSATHAALLLAQGSGRLIRTRTDRGVVAVLDPRLVTARYGAFLRASLPPMWMTDDGALVRSALVRLRSGGVTPAATP